MSEEKKKEKAPVGPLVVVRDPKAKKDANLTKYLVKLGHDGPIVVEASDEGRAEGVFKAHFGITKSKHDYEITEYVEGDAALPPPPDSGNSGTGGNPRLK